jgi:exonuclease III
VNNSSKQPNVCLFNARSINNKSLQLKDYVVDRDIDILGITETWLKEQDGNDFVIRNITPTGYHFIHVPRVGRIGGGIGFICKNTLKIKRLNSSSHNSFEHMEILLYTSVHVTCILLVYRPPPSAVNNLTQTQFYDEFSSLLECMVSSPGKLLIAGDFNFHIDDKTDTRATKFVDLLNCFNMSILNVMTPTHQNNHVLDLLISISDINVYSLI